MDDKTTNKFQLVEGQLNAGCHKYELYAHDNCLSVGQVKCPVGITFDLLATLGENHLKHIIKTYLAHTEFTNLIDDKKVLTV